MNNLKITILLTLIITAFSQPIFAGMDSSYSVEIEITDFYYSNAQQ